jgi:hypothetical protein
MSFDEDETQAAREERFAAERAARKAARKVAELHLGGAHVGAAISCVVLGLLAAFGEFVAVGVVGGILALWFAAGLTWAYVDGDSGRHAVLRAYGVTFWWGNGV